MCVAIFTYASFIHLNVFRLPFVKGEIFVFGVNHNYNYHGSLKLFLERKSLLLRFEVT